MKKHLFTILILIFAVSSMLFAGTPRTYLQRCSLDTGLEAPVTNTGTTHNPDYIIRATCVETGEVLGSDLGTPSGSLRISRAGTSPNFYTAATLQLGTFPTQWVAGQTITMWVKYVPTNETATWNLIIPAGGTTINVQSPVQVIPPYTPAGHDLIVNSTPAGYAILKDGVPTGQVTPYTFSPGEAGTYTLAPRAGYAWNPIQHVVGELTQETTIAFVSEWVNVDPLAAINPTPANGAVITRAWDAPLAGDVTLMWEPDTNGPAPAGYKLYWNGALTPMDLGAQTSYVATGLTAGAYTWQIVPYIYAPAGKQAVNTGLRVSATSRSTNVVTRSTKDSAKGDAVNCPLWSFSIVYDAPPPVYYDFEVTSEPVGATIWVNGVETAFVAPHTFSMMEGSSALYAVSMVGYEAWTPENFQVTNIMQPGSVNFIGTPVYVPQIPADVPTEISMGVEITSTINLDYTDPSPAQNAVIVALPNFSNLNNSVVTVLTGTGIGTFTIEVSNPGLWFGMIYYGGTWHQASPFMLVVPPAPGIFTFANIDFDAKGDVIVLLGEGADPTLPVELSSFAAVPMAQNFVALTWTSESETEMLGYRVYRSTTNDVNSATMITPVIIPAYNTSTTQNYKHEDHEVELNVTYWYWLESVDYGTSHFHGPVSATVTGNTVPELPIVTMMGNAYPNPFRMGNNANIQVSVKAGENASVTVYNILGQAVKTFKVNEGNHNLQWNGRDSKGNLCGSGIYFYKLSSPSMNQTKKMVIIK